MELTADEKKVIVSILKKNLEEVTENEERGTPYLLEFSKEVNYSDFLSDLIKKLS